ncbi:uncharacterized protein LOC107363232 isoform X3 [Tetranychus urticae]|uniref:uncharacterized protein LOC107363232 isoform X3 n=1 Tax=Tetranychus urticae TaxID=32264 RepID=UPI000D64B19A|nr:uncharacterized protein LOC107363232 isoform X3 [Tetranychus urticae]
MGRKKLSALLSIVFLLLTGALFIYTISIEDVDTHTIKKSLSYPHMISNASAEYDHGNSSNPGCILPEIDSFDPAILPYIHNVSLHCKQSPQLTVINSDDRLVIQIPDNTHESVDCYYSWVYRAKSDGAVSYGPVNVIPSTGGVQFDSDANVVNTSCVSQKTKQVIYRNVHFHVPTFKQKPSINYQTNPSVIILVIESLSRLSFQRFLPSVDQALQDIGNFQHLSSLNRVEENSFPNSMALLAGKAITDNVASSYHGIHWDNKLPFIWNTFKESGYVTSFLEDQPMAGLFSYYNRGFLNRPTDFYPVEFWSHMYPEGTKHMLDLLVNPINYCFEKVGSKVELFLSMCSKFVEDVINRQRNPYFLYAFYSQMTHEDFNNFQLVDQPVAQFLLSLSPSVLNNSIVIVMGDHGPRVGAVTKSLGDPTNTPYARVEGSLPFFAMRIPDSLDSQYPHLRKYLASNEKRLTSWYDIHQILLDTAQGHFKPIGTRKETPVAYSIFREEIPISRTCEDANISPVYCACNGRVGINPTLKSFHIDAAKGLVNELRTIFHKNKCRSRITFEKILSGEFFYPRSNETWSTYERANLTIKVKPSQAVITGMVYRSRDSTDYRWSPWKFYDPTNKLNSAEYTKYLTKLLCVNHVLKNVNVAII